MFKLVLSVRVGIARLLPSPPSEILAFSKSQGSSCTKN